MVEVVEVVEGWPGEEVEEELRPEIRDSSWDSESADGGEDEEVDIGIEMDPEEVGDDEK